MFVSGVFWLGADCLGFRVRRAEVVVLGCRALGHFGDRFSEPRGFLVPGEFLGGAFGPMGTSTCQGQLLDL